MYYYYYYYYVPSLKLPGWFSSASVWSSVASWGAVFAGLDSGRLDQLDQLLLSAFKMAAQYSHIPDNATFCAATKVVAGISSIDITLFFLITVT